MEAFLRYIICELVDYPDEVVITTTEAPGKILLHLVANKADIPKIIGKGGHTIQALRSLLQASGQKKGVRVSLEIIE